MAVYPSEFWNMKFGNVTEQTSQYGKQFGPKLSCISVASDRTPEIPFAWKVYGIMTQN